MSQPVTAGMRGYDISRRPNRDFNHNELERTSDIKENGILKEILSLPSAKLQELEFATYRSRLPVHHRASSTAAWLKEKANQIYARGLYRMAISEYKLAVRAVVADHHELLSSEYVNKGYIDALKKNVIWTLVLDLVCCCNNTAQAHLKLGERVIALDWLQEIDILYYCHSSTRGTSMMNVVEYVTYRMKAALRMANLFLALGNTSLSSYHTYFGSTFYPVYFPDGVKEVEVLQKQFNTDDVLKLRSPDITYIDNWDVADPQLQIRGVWKKLRLKSPFRPQKCINVASWIWKSKLYVFGGRSQDVTLWDIRFCDLGRLKKWFSLPPVPNHLRRYVSSARKPVVYGDHAYFFNGYLRIVRFNMVTESWDDVLSTYGGSEWPLQEKTLDHACLELYNDTLYVYGGEQNFTPHGLTILLALNLRTLRWKYIGGVMDVLKDWPPPRQAAASWIIPSEERLYIMFGNSDYGRPLAGCYDPDVNHLDDLWSFSIKENQWRRERIRGNHPSPRDHMTAVFHKGLGVVIAFGGTNKLLPIGSQEGSASHLALLNRHTYYGDTYIMETSPNRWKQVITRNFPAWRAEAKCLVDEETNKIYLFGGLCNNLYLDPDSNFNIHAFNDIWHLDLDMVGTDFDSSSFFRNSRYLKIGSWRRCYSCKAIGRKYMRCQGSCNGNFIFCSVACQRASWKRHRDLHHCRRLR